MKIELEKIEAGDYIDCDELLQSLLDAGFNAEYKNIHEDSNGFLAHFFIDGEYVGAVDSNNGNHYIRSWNGLNVTK